MKTEIIESYQTFKGNIDFRTDFRISSVLPINENTYAILKSKYQHQDVIEIHGKVSRTIEISSLIPKPLQLNHTNIFIFKNGLGYMDHQNSKLILLEELEGEPIIVNILKSKNLDLDMKEKCMAFVSHDNSDDTLLIGINDRRGNHGIARYWTILQLPEIEFSNEINLEWDNVQDLNPNFYPTTMFNHQYPGLEWLSIIDMIKIGGLKYCYTTGGKRTRMKSGPEYEFSILSKIDSENRVVKNIEIEKGKRSFSANKKFLIVRPKSKKRLVIYSLEKMELAYEVPLKPKNNMGEINGDRLVAGDLFENKLYISSLEYLNICEIIK